MAGVLVVDDESLIRFFFSKALSKKGIYVVGAGNGREAMDMIDKSKYDLAVVDLRLGDINGIDIVRYLRKISPETKIIVITAFSTEEVRNELNREGIDDFYEKPFDSYEIINSISRHLPPKYCN